MRSKTTAVLWIVYISLLAVLLPHTANMFSRFEPTSKLGTFSSWALAFAFEASIAGLTYKLAERIESKPNRKHGVRLFAYRYLNPFSVGLIFATVVSGLANLAHAVEFGQDLKIFTEWGIPSAVYSLAFGGILPLVSLTFAFVLSNVTDEEAPNPELETAKATIKELNKQIRELEHRAKLAEDRFGAAGDLMKRVFGDDKRERILAVREWKPKLPGSYVAMITETSPAYVSEVLNTVDAEAK